jgi:hypothetical protein
MLCLAIAAASAVAVCAEVFNLDDSVPFVMSNGVPVRWTHGWDALTVADSACVRVSSRGVFAKPSHWTPRALSGLGWGRADCVPGEPGVLCTTHGGAVFPTAHRPVYNASAAWHGLECTREADGRLLDPGRLLYDVSACDVLDAGGDAVVCGRSAWTRHTGVADWVYWALCLLAVLIVRALSYLVVRRLAPHAEQTPEHPMLADSDALTVGACVAALPLVLIPEGDAEFVTEEERFFFLFLCGYVLVYTLLFAQYARQLNAQGGPPIYNLIAATLQLVASRLYSGVETPYNPILIWAIATRALVKLRAGFDPVASTTVLLDSLLLALMCALGFPYPPLYLLAIACAALTTTDAFC